MNVGGDGRRTERRRRPQRCREGGRSNVSGVVLENAVLGEVSGMPVVGNACADQKAAMASGEAAMQEEQA